MVPSGILLNFLMGFFKEFILVFSDVSLWDLLPGFPRISLGIPAGTPLWIHAEIPLGFPLGNYLGDLSRISFDIPKKISLGIPKELYFTIPTRVSTWDFFWYLAGLLPYFEISSGML